MNKVVSIHLNGVVFTIDENAYEQLKAYLDKLKTYFGNTAGASEIVQDIEARIAELLSQRIINQQVVVGVDDVQAVISQMGNPGEIADNPEPEQAKQTNNERKLRRDAKHKTIGGVCAGIANYLGIDIMVPRVLFLVAFLMFGSGLLIYIILWAVIPESNAQENSADSPSIRRLFRNTEQQTIGGVCSGAADYLGIDAIWIRLAFVAAFLFFGTGFLAYLILWIAIPAAKTPSEKLQMKGEPVDVQNIERVVRDGINRASGTLVSQSAATKGIKTIASAIAKIIGGILLISSIVSIGIVLFLWNTSFANILTQLDITSYYKYFEYGFGLFSLSVAGLLLVVGVKLLFHTRIKIKYLALLLCIGMVTGLLMVLHFGWQYRQSVHEKMSVKQTVLQTQAPDTLYIEAEQYETVLDNESINGSVVINNETSSKTFKLTGMDHWVKVFYNSRLSIKPSVNDSMSVVLIKTARGNNPDDALRTANAIQYKADLIGNTLKLDNGIRVEKNQRFKYQQVWARIKVPVGTIIKVDPQIMKMINKHYEADFDLGETFKMTRKGLICLDCEDTEDEMADDDVSIEWNIDEDDGEVNIQIKTESTHNDTEEVKVYGSSKK
ncbi:MAG: PspC domain-containing protein [Bacteroidia bacterium]|jgi:phage shock protein PspC (stress-responsive transcriptional regulator)|nr:PspC domain-containing protein [Bacteroidia bacterium]